MCWTSVLFLSIHVVCRMIRVVAVHGQIVLSHRRAVRVATAMIVPNIGGRYGGSIPVDTSRNRSPVIPHLSRKDAPAIAVFVLLVENWPFQ